MLLLLEFYVPWVCFFWSVASPLDIFIKFFVQIAKAFRAKTIEVLDTGNIGIYADFGSDSEDDD